MATRTPRARWRGKIFDLRTIDMLKEVERLSAIRLRPVQGSYSNGSASAGTHTGGGAVDLSVAGLTRTQILRVVKAMRQVGFVAWWRTPADGFQHHIHGIAVGGPDLPRVARGQIASARLGRNGLRSNKKDPQAFLKVPVTTWEKYKATRKKPFPAYPKAGAAAFRVGSRGEHIKVIQVARRAKPTGRMTGADLDWIERYERNRYPVLGTPNQIVGKKTYNSLRTNPLVKAHWKV